MKTTVKPGNKVTYTLGVTQVVAQCLEVYENGDIRTDQDGIRTKNEYTKLD